MQLQYDEKLVEAAVLLCSSGRRAGVPALQIRRFHRERERPYAIMNPDERDAAFFDLHLSWFREWGLQELLVQALAEFPLLQRSLSTLVFRAARNRNEEGAELFVNETARHAVAVLRAERFSENASLATFLRHEFTHLHDMLDPEFGYSRELALSRDNPAHQTLTRERYRVLWDITIDGRIAARGHTPMASRERHWTHFLRGYSFWELHTQQTVFDSLWHDVSPRHSRLLDLASDPRGLRQTSLPVPGARCPLCGFPTFEWSSTDLMVEPVAAVIREQFPHWTFDQGVCGRCFEIYRMIAAQHATAV